MMDLFGNKLNHKLPRYVFFNISWDELDSFVWSCGLDSSGDAFIAENQLAFEGPLAISTCGHSCFETYFRSFFGAR